MTLIALALITTLLILAVSSNVVLSLGMVGALSIVRFRTAIKEPMDIAFLFWSIAVGIVLAAGLLPLAVLGSAFVGLVLWWVLPAQEQGEPLHPGPPLCRRPGGGRRQGPGGRGGEKVEPQGAIERHPRGRSEKLNYEVRLREGDADFVNTLGGMGRGDQRVLVSYNGDYMG